MNLDLEEVRSEFQRSSLIVILFSLILITATANILTVSKNVFAFYGGSRTFIVIASWAVIFLVYEVLVLYYLRKKIYGKRKEFTAFKFINTLIEISFPSLIMLYQVSEYKMLSFIDSPVAFTYFLFVILSILHLDFKVSLFTGAIAALQYIAITFYGFNYVTDVPNQYMPAAPEHLHYLRSIILFFCGAAAAFVAADLKNRIKTTYDYINEKKELELLFGQQVSKEVSRTLIEEKGATKRLEATVMFLDIRNFTAFADTHTPDEVIDYQNKFLAPVIDIINQHQGVVFQILGDGVMACFGSPVENVLHADVAFQASLEILKTVRRNSEEGLIPQTRIGIGLHSGPLVAGNIGNEQRKQFSVSGTPVIIASRIEQLNKKYETEFIISEDVYSRISTGKIPVDYLGEEPLKGFGKPLKIYSVDAQKKKNADTL
jgi:adenylate cyclase